MKPSARSVLMYLERRGTWVNSYEIVRDCLCTTPSKRLDELHDLGVIEKRPHPTMPRWKQYRVKEGQV